MVARLVLLAVAVMAVAASASALTMPTNRASSLAALAGWDVTGGVNGGGTCASCTVVVGLVVEVAAVNKQSVATLLSEVCEWFPVEMRDPCTDIVKRYGPTVIALIADGLHPDAVCLRMDLCKSATCHLFPTSARAEREHAVAMAKQSPISIPESKAGVTALLTPWQWIMQEINRVFNSHEPLIDLDNDFFSTARTLRGTSWRGKDCNDHVKGVYPGRIDDGSEAHIDRDCNGISGTNPATGKSYEEELCAGTTQLGTIILGDSAGAHFHIPPEYLSPPLMNKTTYQELLFVLENEFDWPQQSATTAFLTQADRWDMGPIDSIYEHMRNHNRCNHRDYQNIAVNGARSGAMNDTIVRSLARDMANDKPALISYALIGNDVCNGHPDYWNTMTTPQEFYNNVVDALTYLDSTVPNGSHLVFTGLPDGRILYDAMNNRTHPIGGGVTYASMYDWMNCLEISPCLVWMNSNSTIRDAGSARAAELNEVYKAIIANHTFSRFDMQYYDMPVAAIFKAIEAKGMHAWDIIEPVDGFHPNQLSMALTATYMWNQLQVDHPNWFGAPNPNNDKIDAIFGDQGGY